MKLIPDLVRSDWVETQAKLFLPSAQIILLDLSCPGSFRSQHSKVLMSVWPSINDLVHRYMHVYDKMLQYDAIL